MQLHRLEGFYWVARERGYARAARAFPYPITQPAVHQQVRKLEAELGIRLFDRVAKDRVALTAAGERLFAFCAPFFEQLGVVVDEIQASRYGGVLRIDTSALVLRELLPEWLRALRGLRPDIQVEVAEVDVPSGERLVTGRAHVAIDFCPQIPPECESRRVANSHAFLILPADLGATRRVSFEDLRDAPFVSYHPSLPHHALQMAAVRSRFGEPVRTVAASSVDAILAFVRAGLGYSVIPWLSREGPRVEGVVARRQRGAGTTFPILALWRRGSRHPLVEALLEAQPDP
ncbi:MAG: LysR family transcriptional regulator [Deltaproteobacteria bacterium]|jgi:DNA-binding transcriptional LysR family regulator|nr:LysR family transcriptional regulator [Deltaproteobacteria bacterium]MBW2536890.1 LysR family transcriptional regulator [Deltaproteobacteria bacterium]